MSDSRTKFKEVLLQHYLVLFETPEYALAKAMQDPAEMAGSMVAGLARTPPTANKDGEGIKRTCKALGIPYTYKAIKEYLTS